MKSLRLILSNPRYFGPAWAFASLNILFGTWAIYIPMVKEDLGIDKATLGIALFFLSFGVFTVFPVASRIVNYLGVGRATWYGILGLCLTALFPLMANSFLTLALALFFFGSANGLLDIAMNTLVTEIEKEDKQNFMSASHGFFSLGGVLAGLGSFLILVFENRMLHMIAAVILVLSVNLIFSKRYLHIKAAPVEKEPFSFRNFKPLLLLGVVSFVVMASEGAIVDWSGLFLKEVSLAPEALWGAGFLGFQITMTLGRFLGDAISARIGSVRIVALGSSIAIAGYLCVLAGHTYMAILGFALTGLGFSVIIPELFRIGGNVKGVESSQGVAFIAGSGYSGFLLGPVILGFLAEQYSLNTSFSVLLTGVVVVLFTSLLMRKNRIRKN
ncbi:Fucose permease [Muriicola jejuensis]|uniref:MFS transporter n=1 Tax=Muriicola jejuensis TaxID=504488 RepID=A0A6P0UGM4_9FLAO|nr:MFS transporter [Muriicola jejuensis]NER09276.1 MFS transporter [Muriicola jejuensis]SMP09822.1 Fucose permease [Muriicola jejuensis]